MRHAEDYPRLDLALLRRSPEWTSGHAFSWKWSRSTGLVTCRATITRLADHGGIEIELDTGVQQHIAFGETPARFGGVRRWFLCPVCERRCRVLDKAGERFGCRRCYRLSYRSECEKKPTDAADRALRRARAIIVKLGGEEPEGFPPYTFPPKPPRMHWRTYWRLHERAASLERRGVEALEASVHRMTERSRAALAAFDEMKARAAATAG